MAEDKENLEKQDDEIVPVETDEEVKTTEPEVKPEKVEPSDDPASAIDALRKQVAEYETREKKSQEAIAAERHRTETERRARAEAERRVGQASTDAVSYQRQVLDAHLDSIINGLAAANSQMAQAKSTYRQALSDADHEKAADLAGEIGVIASRIRAFEDGKIAIEEQRKVEPRQQQQQPAQQQDTEEAFIQRLPPRSAEWVRSHRDKYFGDSRFQQLVAGAHQIALGRGISPETDDYFKFIEEQAGIRQPEPVVQDESEKPAPVSKAAAAAPRRSPTPAAPASGSSGAAVRASSSGGAVELTPQERELCKTMDMDETAYAKQKKKLMDEGEIGVRH